MRRDFNPAPRDGTVMNLDFLDLTHLVPPHIDKGLIVNFSYLKILLFKKHIINLFYYIQQGFLSFYLFIYLFFYQGWK